MIATSITKHSNVILCQTENTNVYINNKTNNIISRPQKWMITRALTAKYITITSCGIKIYIDNKENLRDLIAVTGLVISNRQVFCPCDGEIWWMTSKNNRALYYVKLCASFQIHWWIQTGFTVQKRSIRVEIRDKLSCVTLKFDGRPWKTIGHLFYATSSFVQHFVAIGEFKLQLQSGNAHSGSNPTIFWAVWPWNLTDDLEKQ